MSCRLLIAILATLLVPEIARAEIEPFAVAPWPDQPWWAWPAPPDGHVRGPCAAWHSPADQHSPRYDYRYDPQNRLVEVLRNSLASSDRVRIEWEGGKPVRETWTHPGDAKPYKVVTYDKTRKRAADFTWAMQEDGFARSATRMLGKRREVWQFVWRDKAQLERIEASVDGNGGFDAAFKYDCK